MLFTFISWTCFLISLILFLFCGGCIYESFDLHPGSRMVLAGVEFLMPFQLILAFAIYVSALRSFERLSKLYKILMVTSVCLLVLPCVVMMILFVCGG